ncbi:sulfatase-like hydrolase/transferase [Martelella mediterranea]|uniref:Phosphoglycerol transferase MdoB-like AlkP superfamily enzyme n=1 Tax=Martelella mediterranea TaxID=293089 RepID=A0A4R3NM61_9HYPH|nr:sulfatase-like hydrolase/transferase [Martelella mediterranea]TCT36283.1 phosphoglycerol transferase MdoB-like AlkP superfamily enzyme [Martelella mediterranea]
MIHSKRSDRNNISPQAGLLIWAIIFLVLATAVLNMPGYPSGLKPATFLKLPLEVPLTGLALLVLSGLAARLLAFFSTLAIGTVLFLRLADIGVQSAFQRRFNPYLDAKMIADGWNVLSGSIGTLTAASLIIATIAVFILVLLLLFTAQVRLADAKPPITGNLRLVFGSLAGVGLIFFTASQFDGMRQYASLQTPSYLTARLTLISKSMDDMRHFDQDLAARAEKTTDEYLFRGVAGRDIILIFIESYGRSAVEDSRYAPLIQPRLASVGDALTAKGFSAASGWTRSPTMGGLSWLAHGTFLSGLWVDNQARYDRLMISDWPSLNSMFRDSGWRTAAVMPAITMAWPEAEYYGYDQIFAAADLGYKGKTFNWVTMPDQYTLSAFDRLVRHPAAEADKPVMAEIALISSHAPWTPVPRLIDWLDVGNGEIFDRQAESGDPPGVVWADDQRIRRQYIQTIDYSLHTVGDYVAKFGDDAVFVVLGDHQPAPLVTGPDASRDVPIHIISRDRNLVRRFEAEGFSPGMIPAEDAANPPMDSMRGKLIRIFSQAQ